MKNKIYTVSTMTFNSLENVREKLEEWDEAGTLNPQTKVLEVVGEVPWTKEITFDNPREHWYQAPCVIKDCKLCVCGRHKTNHD